MGVLTTGSATGSNSYVLIIWIVAMVAIVYFFMIRPNNKEKKRVQQMMSNMDVGDYVVTTSGFYGEIINISDEDVIVEFGNNKNCRIPMRKAAIAEVEKAGTAQAAPAPAKKEESEKK